MKRHFALIVDPIACDGHGLCAELFPEQIELDRWGYPVIEGSEIDPRHRAHALRAVAACPRMALHVTEVAR